MIIRKGKNWKLEKNKSLGNFKVTFKGKTYIHATKAIAENQIKSIISVNRKLATKKRKK